MDYISEKMGSLPTEYDDPLTMDAVLYRVQTSIDSMTDICAILCKDLGQDVEDDYHNIDKLHNNGIIDDELTSRLKQLNGLRNVIVHKYNGIQEDIITDNIPLIQKTLKEFIVIVKTRLQNID